MKLSWRTGLGLVGLGLGLMLAGCSSSDEDGEPSHPHWSYSGTEGPEYWGSLSEEYAACDSGKHQSPVEFPEELATSPLDHLAFDYLPTSATLLDNGHTIVVEFGENENKLLVDGKPHQLLQFHFHAASEHRVDGDEEPLEMHLVHQANDGGLAVVGIFLEEGDENEPLAEVFSNMENASSKPLSLGAVDLEALLPDDKSGWAYSGSLTTPPCSEGVKWNVYANPISVSPEQLEAFTKLHPGSNRPIQDNEDVEEQLAEESDAEIDS